MPALADVAAVYVHPVGPLLPLVAGTGPRPAPPAQGRCPRAITVAPALLDRHGTSAHLRPAVGATPLGESSAGAPAGAGLGDPRPRAHAVLTSSPTDQWLSKAEGHTVAVLPLAVAGEIAGGVVLVSADSRSPYTRADVPFLEDVAARAGAAVTHLRTFDQQRQIARDLQRALLPDVPTTLPGLRVAARYVAGGAGHRGRR